MKRIVTKTNFSSIALIALAFVVFSGATAYGQTIDTLWIEDFEGTDWVNDWHADYGTWEVGIPTSGPDTAHSGTQCAATDIGGNYSEPVNSKFIRHTSFIVPSASDNPRLRFWHWFSISSGDYGYIQIREVGGEWHNLSVSFGNTGSGVWTYPSYDLSDYEGLTVEIAFYFHSENVWPPSNPDVSSGWYIDDVIVITGGIRFNDPEDWESGLGDWHVSRGTWQVGEPTSGPGSAYSGLNCAATRLDGNYQEPVSTRLISPMFEIPDVSYNPSLRFSHWYSMSSGDFGGVQIREVGEETWETITDPVYTGSSDGWSTPTYLPLTDYAGLAVEIAFYFHSENVWPPSQPDVSSGWYIDSIYIQEDQTGISDDDSDLPVEFTLNQNYPNPFNPATTIDYALPEPLHVSVEIFDILGCKVETLVNKEQPAGYHQVIWHASDYSTGIYFYRLRAGSYTETKKMMLLK